MIRSKDTYGLVMAAIEGITSDELLLDAVAVRVTEALEEQAVANAVAEEIRSIVETPNAKERIHRIDVEIRMLKVVRQRAVEELYGNLKAQAEKAMQANREERGDK